MSDKRFVKQTLTGYKDVPGMMSDPECTHVILTKEEYSFLIDNPRRIIEECNRRIHKTTEEANTKITNVNEKAANKIFQIKQDYEMKYGGIEERLEEALDDAEKQRKLNSTLIRINKEKSNAERNLRPKKQHSGYRVMRSEEIKQKCYIKGRYENVVLWKTVIQTPYSVDYSEEEIRTLTKELFTEDENKHWLIQKLGINGNYNDGYESMLKDPDWNDHEKYNVAVSRNLNANFREGYWEVIITHTKPLGVVPKDMRYK